MAEDYYRTLGVSKTATPEEIKKAYRTQARKLHPDLNPNDPKAKEKFQQLQEAFDVIDNPEKRKIYDQFGVSPDKMGQGPSGEGGFQWNGARSPFTSSGSMDLDDILGMFGMGGMGGTGGMGGMGGGRGAGRRSQTVPPQRGADIERTISIPFSESILGGTIDMSIRAASGKLETISVKIPVGIENGKKIRLRGKGHPGVHGGKPGDILITVKVLPHPHFRREDRNLYVTVPVTLREVVFGAKIELPSPKGTVTISVPPGSSSGTKLRLKGAGVPAVGRFVEPGNLVAELSVRLPKHWSEEDKKLLEKIHAELPEPVRADLKWDDP